MWKQKIGFSVPGDASEKLLRLLAETGFDAVSPEWGGDLEKLIGRARHYGLAIQSLHAPFANVSALWREDRENAEAQLRELLAALEDCRRYEIPVMVLHTWIGFDTTDLPNEIGFSYFDRLIAAAKEVGVKLALENTEGGEFLAALMERYRGDDTVGFCWDSGHEMCYNHSEDLLAEYGDRLLMTHLNDNLGISRFDGTTFWTDDLHLLPYDGIADWEKNVDRLRRSAKQEILNFELNLNSKPGRHENDCYGQMPLELYLAECYKRACRIAFRYAD